MFISGAGTNLQALIDSCRDPSFPAEVALVVSSEPAVSGLERAKRADVPAVVIRRSEFPNSVEFEGALHETLVKHDIHIVCLAGGCDFSSFLISHSLAFPLD